MSLKEDLIKINNEKNINNKKQKLKIKQQKKEKIKQNRNKKKQLNPNELFQQNIKNGDIPESWNKYLQEIIKLIKKDISSVGFSVSLSLTVQEKNKNFSNRQICNLFNTWATRELQKNGLKSAKVCLANKHTYYTTEKDYENFQDMQDKYDEEYRQKCLSYDSDVKPYHQTATLRSTGVIDNWEITANGRLYGKGRTFLTNYKKHKFSYTFILLLPFLLIGAVVGSLYYNYAFQHNSWNIWPSEYVIENTGSGTYKIMDKDSNILYQINDDIISEAYVYCDDENYHVKNEVLGFTVGYHSRVSFLNSIETENYILKNLTIDSGYIVNKPSSQITSLETITILDNDLSDITFFDGYYPNLNNIILENATEIPSYFFKAFYTSNDINIVMDKVTVINEYAFESIYAAETNLIIPASVQTIGNCAFTYADLNSISFAENSSLTTMGEYVFYNCLINSSITLPDSLTTIGEYSFANSHFENINLTGGITTIPSYLFDSASVRSLTLPDSVTSVCSFAFKNSEIQDLILPKSIEYFHVSALAAMKCLVNLSTPFIGQTRDQICGSSSLVQNGMMYLFYDIYIFNEPYYQPIVMGINNRRVFLPISLSKIEITDDETINTNTFSCYHNATASYHNVELYITAKTIDCSAFENNCVISSVHLNGVETINAGAFDDCHNLTTVDLGNSLKYIGLACFEETAITTITIPSTIEYVGEGAFYQCESLESIKLYAGTDTSSWDSRWNNGNNGYTIQYFH